MTETQRARLAKITARNVLAPVSDVTFLLDVIRQMKNHTHGRNGLTLNPTQNGH